MTLTAKQIVIRYTGAQANIAKCGTNISEIDAEIQSMELLIKRRQVQLEILKQRKATTESQVVANNVLIKKLNPVITQARSEVSTLVRIENQLSEVIQDRAKHKKVMQAWASC